MDLHLKRYAFGDDSTGGLLLIRGVHECYTIEDQVREGRVPYRRKVHGETAIPYGSYDVELRTVGGFHQRYLDRYGPEFHKGMLHVKDVPGFEYILFHSGNTDDHTEGCIIVGNTIQTVNRESQIQPGYSRPAYESFYRKVKDAIQGGESVALHIDKMRI